MYITYGTQVRISCRNTAVTRTTRTFAGVKPRKTRHPTWHHADVVQRGDEVTFRGVEVAGEEERQPEEEGVVGELEEAEGDGVRSHGRDSESLNGTVVRGKTKERDGEIHIAICRLKKRRVRSVCV